MKKYLTITFAVLALVWMILRIEPQKIFISSDCPFCKELVIDNQVVYRENGCIALLNYKPARKGHMLILPERHVERFEDLTTDELVNIHTMVSKVDRAERKIVGSTGYLLLQKNGREAGQSVPHVHFHYFPMSQGDSKVWTAIRMFIASWLRPLSEEEMHQQRLEFERHGLAD